MVLERDLANGLHQVLRNTAPRAARLPTFPLCSSCREDLDVQQHMRQRERQHHLAMSALKSRVAGDLHVAGQLLGDRVQVGSMTKLDWVWLGAGDRSLGRSGNLLAIISF